MKTMHLPGIDGEDEPLVSSPQSSEAPSEHEAAAFKGVRAVYAYYILALLLVAYMFHQFDRTILVFLKDEVNEDIPITDGEYGLLVGYGFAVLYGLCGIPFGFLADRLSRKLLLFGGLVFWSVMVFAQGFSKEYAHLLAARIGLGIGEATFTPAALALLSDYFPAEQRVLPNSILQFGVFLGTGIAAIVSGLNKYDWNVILISAGVFGVVLALLVMITLVEPRRGRYDDVNVAANINSFAVSKGFKRYSYSDTIMYMVSLNTPWRLFLAAGLRAIGGLVLLAFTPSFLKRIYCPSADILQCTVASNIDLSYGATTIVGGVCATVLGGFVTRYWLRKNVRAPGYVCALTMLASVPFICLVFTAQLILPPGESGNNLPSLALSFSALFCAFLFSDSSPGPSAYMFQSLLPAAMQASGFSWYFTAVTIIGGAGPEVAGIILDRVPASMGFVALIGVVAGSFLLSAMFYLYANVSFEDDLLSRELFEVGGEHDEVSRQRVWASVGAIVVLTLIMTGLITMSFLL